MSSTVVVAVVKFGVTRDAAKYFGNFQVSPRRSSTISSFRLFRALRTFLAPKMTTAAPEAASAGPSSKIGGYELYRDVLGSPKHVVAPMVDQSELVCLYRLVWRGSNVLTKFCSHGGYYLDDMVDR